MTNIIDNKTNACNSENDADGAEAVDVILVAFPMGYLFHGTQFYRGFDFTARVACRRADFLLCSITSQLDFVTELF